MDYRPITEADLEACIEVFYAADEELTARSGLPPMPRNPAAMMRIFGHILRTDPDRVWLAAEKGAVTAFGMACQRDDVVFLSFLFVLPEAQARGLGRELLERCMASSDKRAVCIFSVQPVSAALYARYGMVPKVPLYTLTGRPRSPLPELPAGMRLGPLDSAAAAEIDRAVTGLTRPVDHDAWRAWDRRPYALLAGGETVGYGYAQPSGRLGPVVVQRPEWLLPLVGRLMREVEPAEDWMVHVPGPAAETFGALLRAGLRLDGPPVIYCASDSISDHGRYLPATFALP